jgi:hypothetical protein
MTFCTGFRTEVCKEIVYPERLLNPGDEYPLPLIKIFDQRGRWCGRLCDLTAAIDDPHNADLRLLLLSTCAARKIHIANVEEEDLEIKSVPFQFSFDKDVFPVYRPDGTAARLVNLLLIESRGVVGDLFHRVGLCQIHQDVWDPMEKVMRSVMLE